MSYPRSYPTGTGDNKCDDNDWNAMVARINGFSATGDYVSPYSWLITYNGITSTYDVCNAFQIAYSHANPVTAIDWALSHLTGGRTWKEKIVFNSTFSIPIATQIDVPHYVCLEGGVFEAAGDMDAVFGYTGSHDITFRNMEVDCKNGTYTARGFNGASELCENITFDNVLVKDANPNYIVQYGSHTKILNSMLIDTVNSTGDIVGIYAGLPDALYDDGNRVSDFLISGNSLINIYGDCIAGTNAQLNIIGNFIDGNNRALAGTFGISMYGKVDGSIVANNEITQVRNGATLSGGIAVHRATWGVGVLVADKVTINDNTITKCGSNGIALLGSGTDHHTNIALHHNIISETYYGDYAIGGDIGLYFVNDTTVKDNELYSTVPLYIDTIAGTNYIKHNKGFITENSGSNYILDTHTSVTFAHGLSGTPTLVTLGAKHAEVADAIWSADATDLTITVPVAVTDNRLISWRAEYKP